MLNYLIKRTLLLFPVLLGVSIVVFLSLRLAPGDPARQILGPLARPEKVEQLRKELGLDKPIVLQYGIWIWRVLHGDLGQSIANRAPTLLLIKERIAKTLELTFAAFLITLTVSFCTGIISAVFQYSIFDVLASVSALFWLSMPSFWLGLMFILLIAIRIPGLPISGWGGHFWTWEGFLHLILPALTLGLPQAGTFTRIIRSSMLETLHQDYIMTARSKGLAEYQVILKHALRNALIPVITLIGLQLPWLFGGSVIVETVYSWPGMGRLLTTAIFERDYPLVQSIALIYTLIVVIANYSVDIAYSVVDPRIRVD
jgi:peptide/nickel transport system permease protein